MQPLGSIHLYRVRGGLLEWSGAVLEALLTHPPLQRLSQTTSKGGDPSRAQRTPAALGE